MNARPYLDLDVLFSKTDAAYQAMVTRSPAGDGQSATFSAVLSDLELENFVLKVGRFRSRTRRVDSAPVAAAKQVGGQLFEAVFSGTVRECLRRSLDRAGVEEAALRIRLRLSECPELADLPWELLYDRDDDWFLALSDRTPVVRYVQLPNPPRAIPVTLPLRVLVIRSEPSDYPRLDLAAEWAQVAEALGELADSGHLAITELAAPTLGELRRALVRDTFHVLHFMGHGAFDSQRGGVLVFTDRAGRSAPVTSGDLGVMLRDHTSLRLAVLNACEAGRTDPADPFAGVADTLVRRGIPAVVAMQFEVSDDAAVEFAPALYGALVAGRPIDAAVAEARKAMYTVSPLEWATPVLYLRAEDARLFTITGRTKPAASQAAARPVVSQAAARAAEADKLLKEKALGEAETAYREAIRLDPDCTCAHTGLGLVLYDTKRYREAEAAFWTAIQLDPANAETHYGLSRTLRQTKRYPQAQVAFREAIRLEPTSSWAHYGLGWALHEPRRYPEAEAAFREAIRLNPANAEAHIGLGFALSATKRHQEAEAAQREAIHLAPASSRMHTGLGWVLYDTKRYPEAEAAFREAMRLNPADAEAHIGLGWVLDDTKRYPEAEAAFREAIQLDPANSRSHTGLGWVLYETKRYPEAEAAFRLNPADAEAHIGLGWVLDDTKRYPEAEAAFREAIQLDPANADGHYGLSSVLDRTNRYPEAMAAYREAIRLDPTRTGTQNKIANLFRTWKRGT